MRQLQNIINLDKSDKELLQIYAKCNMNKLLTARVGYRARGTVNYRFKKIYACTGYNPQNFYDLMTLITTINEEETSVA